MCRPQFLNAASVAIKISTYLVLIISRPLLIYKGEHRHSFGLILKSLRALEPEFFYFKVKVRKVDWSIDPSWRI